ncbi:DUF1120 domain-containing protein [Serratia microhaemolytica]|uniref:DUF1120 domain-containing protein n=1 Tax=Serratia microhaemolytica TaxID=2675110 RepID=UPI0013924146|nr:DUF1120 domain-containing protein [Serratia microhaemolytica]
MLRQVKKSAFALAVIATTSLPAFSAGIELTVKGSITPAACVPTVDKTTADFGKISADSLKSDQYVVLDEVPQFLFTINCPAPTAVAIKAVNNTNEGNIGGAAQGVSKTGYTVVEGVDLFGQGSTSYTAGLGLHGEQKIGGFGLRLTRSMADNSAVGMLKSTEYQETTWQTETTGELFQPTTTYITWGSGSTPQAFSKLTALIEVAAFINKTSDLTVDKEISFSGSTTLELFYP